MRKKRSNWEAPHEAIPDSFIEQLAHMRALGKESEYWGMIEAIIPGEEWGSRKRVWLDAMVSRVMVERELEWKLEEKQREEKLRLEREAAEKKLRDDAEAMVLEWIQKLPGVLKSLRVSSVEVKRGANGSYAGEKHSFWTTDCEGKSMSFLTRLQDKEWGVEAGVAIKYSSPRERCSGWSKRPEQVAEEDARKRLVPPDLDRKCREILKKAGFGKAVLEEIRKAVLVATKADLTAAAREMSVIGFKDEEICRMVQDHLGEMSVRSVMES
jgi:hypothetical protein